MIKTIALVSLLCLSLGAQEKGAEDKTTKAPTLKQDERGLAVFKKFSSLIYRPRIAGLKEVRFQVSIEQLDEARPKESQVTTSGPFFFHWKADKTVVVDKSGKVVPINPALQQRIMADAVGIDPEILLKSHHVSLESPNSVRFSIPKGQDLKAPIRSTLYTADEQGRLQKQALCDAQGRVVFAVSYQYRKRGDLWLVKSSSATGIGTSAREISHVHLAGWTVPTRVIVRAGKVRHTFRYRKWKFGAPKSSKPAPPTSKPTPKSH
ncbi:MAG: hypothetical protein V3W41_03650 [Planctomycetota bacterium]